MLKVNKKIDAKFLRVQEILMSSRRHKTSMPKKNSPDNELVPAKMKKCVASCFFFV